MRTKMILMLAVLALSAPSAFAAVTEMHIWTSDDVQAGSGRGQGWASNNVIGGGAINLRTTQVLDFDATPEPGADYLTPGYNYNVIGNMVYVVGDDRITGSGGRDAVRRYPASGVHPGSNTNFIDETFAIDPEFNGGLSGVARIGNHLYVSDGCQGDTSICPNGPTGLGRTYRASDGARLGLWHTGTPPRTNEQSDLALELGDVVRVRAPGGKQYLVVSEGIRGGPEISVWDVNQDDNIAAATSEISTSRLVSIVSASPRTNKIYALDRTRSAVDEYAVSNSGVIALVRTIATSASLQIESGQGAVLSGSNSRNIDVDPRNGNILIWGRSSANGTIGVVNALSQIDGSFKGLIATASYGEGISTAFTVTPEPATLGLMVMGGMMMLRRRRKA